MMTDGHLVADEQMMANGPSVAGGWLVADG
jgi:hypothetical protein